MSININSEMVKKATSGDHAALEHVIGELQRPLYNLSLRMMGNHHDAEDATQEALLRVVTHLSSFRGDSAFSTWAWTIATRVVLAQRKRRGQQPISVEDFAADLAHERDDGAEEKIEDAVLIQQVKLGCSRAMLQCLDDNHRLAYVLAEILEVPGPEAAQILGIAPEAFRKRASRARQKVRAFLQRMCGVVNPAAACRCHKRIRPAEALGRLEQRDREGRVDVVAVREQMVSVDELSRDRAFYRGEPMFISSPELIDRVRDCLGMTR